MEFLLNDMRASEPVFNARLPVETGTAEYAGKKAPNPAELADYRFEQMAFPLEGGRQFLRLRKPLTLVIDRETLRFTVKDWGIAMDCLHLAQLPREVVRRFLRLLSAAENEALTETDEADWLRISDYVDFQQFSIERSAPHYLEGTLRSVAGVVIVEWHDGSRETLDRDVARGLSEVNPGERFSAFVRLGKGNKALAIERVSLLSSPNEEEDWGSWPVKG